MKLLGICGSLRRASVNRKLLLEAIRLFGKADVTDADLRLPLYDGDLEEAEGTPAPVQALADAIRTTDAIIIACPEYNRGVPGGLKNALDWVSRVKGSVWRDKPVALVSAAEGPAGGARAQFALRLCMVPFRARVLAGPEFLLPAASKAFDENGRLINPQSEKILAELMAGLRAEINRA